MCILSLCTLCPAFPLIQAHSYLNFLSLFHWGAEHHCRAEPGFIHQVQHHPEECSQGWLAMELRTPGIVCPQLCSWTCSLSRLYLRANKYSDKQTHSLTFYAGLEYLVKGQKTTTKHISECFHYFLPPKNVPLFLRLQSFVSETFRR